MTVLGWSWSSASAWEREEWQEKLLERMDGLVPWAELEACIEPHFSKAGRDADGRRHRRLARALLSSLLSCSSASP